MNRRDRVFAFALAALMGTRLAIAQADKADRDFTFFAQSDVHVGAENLKASPPVTREQTLAKIKANLETLRGVAGQPFPERPAFAGLALGAVAPPRGLLVLGDLTDGSRDPAAQREQWGTFDALYPEGGVSFDGQAAPVYAIAGNHDDAVGSAQRLGVAARNRALLRAGRLAALSTNGLHGAVCWDGVHIVLLSLCAADAPDAETPFKFGASGPGTWCDPQGAFAFLKEYLERKVGTSGAPVVLAQHYGFDAFSLNDWNWWTLKQRRALYELLAGYNVAAILHGHNHCAEHYRWPDPVRHAADLSAFFDGKPPAGPRQYDVVSCGLLGWVFRIQGDRLIAGHYSGPGWSGDPARFFVKQLRVGAASSSKE
jgi:3',5'-cyclic AMP phosphodiesterase CpdA